MPRAIASNCPICKWAKPGACAYWDKALDKVVQMTGYICPDPKK
uniref:Uncharacterized protein n=1 Tax=viral metagenome TaxID=1070528 RepID=A0A6M3LG75_9ZZZZ